MTAGAPVAAGVELAAPSPPAAAAVPASARSRLLTSVLVLPATLWYLLLLIVPLGIVAIFSFGVRARDGGYQPAFTLDNYSTIFKRPQPFIDSLIVAGLGTIL